LHMHTEHNNTQHIMRTHNVFFLVFKQDVLISQIDVPYIMVVHTED
jgi:hypothetical protein